MKLFFQLLVAAFLLAGCSQLRAQPVLMNEIYSRGTSAEPDWIELFNNSASAVNISGYRIYDAGGQSGSKPKKAIPLGTTIAARGFYVIVTDDTTSSGFGLSSSGEKVWLEDASGTITDTVTFPAMESTQSYGRYPDGATSSGAPFTLLSERTISVPEPSGLAYNPARNTLFCVSDANGIVYELSLAGAVLRQISTGSSDLEAITFSKNYDTMFVAEEGACKVTGYTLSGVKGSSWSIVTSTNSNNGYEGLTRLPNDNFVVLNEKLPVLALVATHNGIEVSRKALSLSADLSDICYDSTLQCYWIISDESKKVMKVNLDFALMGEWTETIEQGEGIAVAGDKIYIVSDSDSKFYTYTKPHELSGAQTVPRTANANPWSLLNIITKGKPNKITDIREETHDAMEFDLLQNYPNPFNPGTTIIYRIPNSGFVSLVIYDAFGREMKSLVNEGKSAGRHSIEFNADDFPGGVYVAVLRTGDYVSARKLALLK